MVIFEGLEAACSLILSSILPFTKRSLAFPVETDGTLILCQFAVAMCYVLMTTWVRTASMKDISASRTVAVSAVFSSFTSYVCTVKVAPASAINPVPLM